MTSEEKVCPLCMEPMEADDLAFYPCDCRYQVCRFCWAKIINEENGLCPACRKEYNSEKPALYKPISEAEDAKLRSNRKKKDHLKKTKLNAEMLKLLPELRVVQPNLIFVVGLPAWVCKDKEILKGPEYFGRYGKVFKVEINQNQTFGGPQGQPSFSAYITFCRAEDAMRSIKEWDQGMLHGRSLRVSLGTTKYCSQFLRGTKCTKHECMYLHELGDPAASFTKEEMQAGKHTEYMNKLLSEYTPTNTSSTGAVSLESSSSYTATASAEDNQSGSKDLSVHSNARFRGRTDLIPDRSLGSSPLKSNRGGHNRPLTDSEATPTTPLGEGRRTRPFHSEYAYSEFSTKESSNDQFLPSCDTSSNKTNVWNRQLSADYLQASSYKSSTGKPLSSSFTHVYTNGLDGVDLDKCSRLSKKPNELRRIQSSEPSRAAAHRNKSGGAEAYSAPNGNTNCVGSPAEGNWYRSTPPNEPSNHLSDGEDPVDIDFDPFLESQQGLAELLAAEVEKLGLIGEDPSRNTYGVNGRSPSSGNCTAESRSQLVDGSALDHNLSDFRSCHSRRTGYSWMPDFMSCDNEGPADLNQRNSQSLFPRIYPPPGFEDNARVLQQQTDSSVFPNAHLDPLMNFELSESPCSLGEARSSGLGSSNLSCGNGPIPNNTYSFAHVPCNLGNKLDASFETFSQSKFPKSVDSASHYRSPSASYVVPAENNLPFGTHDQAPQRPDSQQAIASLFNTAFNTASAMLNNRAAASGEKSTSCTPTSSPSSFDLSTFFGHLCRHSPFFSSLAAQSVSDWSGVLGSNGSAGTSNTGTRPAGSSQDPLIDSTSAALAAAASVLFPSVQFPQRSADVLSSEDGNSQMNLSNYSFPPGLSKQMPVNLPQGLSEMHADKNAFNCSSNPGENSSSDPSVSATPLTWQLDDPAIVSSQLAPENSTNFPQSNSGWKAASSTSPAELLQQLWRSSSGLSPIFGSQLAPAFGLSSTSQTSGSAVSQRTLRDSSLQSASQSTE